MRGRLVIPLAFFLALSVSLPGSAARDEQSAILKKLDEIDLRLGRIEREMRQINEAMTQLAAGEEGFDVRQTPQYKALEKQFQELQSKLEAQTSRNPAEVWRAMGNPKEVSRRLEMLRELVAPTIPDETRRKEFERDVRALKDKTGKEVSQKELFEQLWNWLSNRLKESSSEREKAWLRDQLEKLEESEGKEREEMVARFVRIGNVRAVHELAQKYSIPRDLMVKAGFPFVGYGGRPGRHRESPDRPSRPPRGRPNGSRRGQR
jgi:hypothetical protein